MISDFQTTLPPFLASKIEKTEFAQKLLVGDLNPPPPPCLWRTHRFPSSLSAEIMATDCAAPEETRLTSLKKETIFQMISTEKGKELSKIGV